MKIKEEFAESAKSKRWGDRHPGKLVVQKGQETENATPLQSTYTSSTGENTLESITSKRDTLWVWEGKEQYCVSEIRFIGH